MEYVPKQFKQSVSSSNAPTEKDKILAKLIISNRHHTKNKVSALETMVDCAYKWKDVEMWRDLMKRFEKNVKANEFIRALRVFTFDQTRSMYVI